MQHTDSADEMSDCGSRLQGSHKPKSRRVQRAVRLRNRFLIKPFGSSIDPRALRLCLDSQWTLEKKRGWKSTERGACESVLRSWMELSHFFAAIVPTRSLRLADWDAAVFTLTKEEMTGSIQWMVEVTISCASLDFLWIIRLHILTI